MTAAVIASLAVVGAFALSAFAATQSRGAPQRSARGRLRQRDPGIPEHVLPPADPVGFTPFDAAARPAHGLGYSVLRAIGAHAELPPSALETVRQWASEYQARCGRLVPAGGDVDWDTFVSRLKRSKRSDRAAENAARYPGEFGQLSYEAVFTEVWVDRRWPALCEALAAEAGAADGYDDETPREIGFY